MIMGGDKKKLAAIIIAQAKPGGEQKDPSPGLSEGLISASDDILSAIAQKSSEDLAMSLKNFFSLMDEPESSEPESDDDQPVGA